MVNTRGRRLPKLIKNCSEAEVKLSVLKYKLKFLWQRN